MSAKIPKNKVMWIIIPHQRIDLFKTLAKEGVMIGSITPRGAPNLFHNCSVPHEALSVMDKLFEIGEILYGPE